MTYSITDPSEHDDIHRGFIDVDGLQLNITITHEGLIVDLYDDSQGDLIGTFANTFTELADMLQDDIS